MARLSCGFPLRYRITTNQPYSASSLLNERTRIERKLVNLDSRRIKLVDAYLNGAIPVDILKTEQNRLATEIETLRRRLATLDTRLERVTLKIEEAVKLASVAAGRYPATAPRRFSKAIFDGVYFEHKRVVRFEWSEAIAPLMRTAASLGGGSAKTSLVELAGLEPATSWVRSS